MVCRIFTRFSERKRKRAASPKAEHSLPFEGNYFSPQSPRLGPLIVTTATGTDAEVLIQKSDEGNFISVVFSVLAAFKERNRK